MALLLTNERFVDREELAEIYLSVDELFPPRKISVVEIVAYEDVPTVVQDRTVRVHGEFDPMLR